MQMNPIGASLIFIFHAIALLFLCPSKFETAKTAKVWCGMVVACLLLSFLFTSLWPNFFGIALSLGLTAILGVLTALWLSSYDTSKTLFLFLAYSHVFMIIVYASLMLSFFFFENSRLAMVIPRVILHFGLVIFCVVSVRNKFSYFARDITKGWWPLNLVVLLMFISMSIQVIRFFANGLESADYLTFLLILLITIAVYWLFFNTIYYMHHATESEKIELQRELLMRQVTDMQESIENARRIRHDVRHHNLLIAEYAEKGEIDELLRYLGQYEKEAENHVIVAICENLAANSILNAYRQKAKQYEIDVRLDVSLEQQTAVSDLDLVAMLANIMENAIHGCIHSGKDDPFIELYIGKKASKLVIYARNTAGSDVTLENGLPKSKNGGGIGVSSILYSAAQYGGEHDFEIEDGVFSCQLLLNEKK